MTRKKEAEDAEGFQLLNKLDSLFKINFLTRFDILLTDECL